MQSGGGRNKVTESKRVLILSDLHCGHNLGLTPPSWWNHFKEIQEAGWNFYTENLAEIGPVDLCIVNGDAVDGPGRKDSLQHCTTDTGEQIKIAITCLEQVQTKRFLFLRGTPYHVTTDTELENAIASHFDAPIFDSKKINVNGCILHVRHHTGKGGTAYGSNTPVQRDAIVHTLSDLPAGAEKSDVYIRSHIHEYDVRHRNLFTTITTPALQFKGTAYGRKLTGFYDYGFVYMDIRSKKDFDIYARRLEITGGDYKSETIEVI